MKRGVLILCLVCFVVLGIRTIYTNHETAYLQSYPQDGLVSVKITYDIDTLDISGSAGNEWTYNHYLNGKKFSYGDIITINAKSAFSIKSEFIERDSIDDVGIASSQKYKYSQNENYKKTISICQRVRVNEDGGRKNKGASETFLVTYTLNRVIPDSAGFFDILFFRGDAVNRSSDTLWGTGITICIVAIVFILIHKKRLDAIAVETERKKIENERVNQEQKFNAEKEAFIRSLNGEKLRQAAGVPDNIVFFAGLPVDNNNSRYGSFTVYLSENGKCYHDKKGCCSSRFPTHYFNAKKRFKPCSKCCIKFRSVPQWYTDYNHLREQARKYNVFMDEEL